MQNDSCHLPKESLTILSLENTSRKPSVALSHVCFSPKICSTWPVFLPNYIDHTNSFSTRDWHRDSCLPQQTTQSRQLSTNFPAQVFLFRQSHTKVQTVYLMQRKKFVGRKSISSLHFHRTARSKNWVDQKQGLFCHSSSKSLC